MEIDSGLLHTMLITSAFILLGAFCWDLAKDIKELGKALSVAHTDALRARLDVFALRLDVERLKSNLSDFKASGKKPESSAAQASQNFEKLKFEFDSNSDS